LNLSIDHPYYSRHLQSQNLFVGAGLIGCETQDNEQKLQPVAAVTRPLSPAPPMSRLVTFFRVLYNVRNTS